MLKSDPVAPPESLPASSERRSHRRVKVVVPAEILIGDEEAVPAGLLSVSLGGAALRAKLDCPVGQRLVLRFRLPDRGWIDFSAELVRASERAVAVRFLALDRASFDALMALLARQST